MTFQISFQIDDNGNISNYKSIKIQPTPKPTPPQPTPQPTPQPNLNRIPVVLSGGMTYVQENTILSLVSIAENSSINWWDQYDYCENINDGRGYTAGFYGFCSGTGDMLEVFNTLKNINNNHQLVKYIPTLEKVNGTKDTTGLENLVKDIKLYNDTQYKTAQWIVCQKLYWNPVIDFCNKNGLILPITKGELYDTIINFGSLTRLLPLIKSQLPKMNLI